MTVRMTDEEIWEFLSEGHTGIFTTLRRDGYPIALPVWYAVVDGREALGQQMHRAQPTLLKLLRSTGRTHRASPPASSLELGHYLRKDQ